MRTYPIDSPQAAARIVALTVLADGDIGQPELDLLDRLAIHEQLGFDRQEFQTVLDSLCEDLLSSGQLQWSDACPVDDRTLAKLSGDCTVGCSPLRRIRRHLVDDNYLGRLTTTMLAG